MWIYNELGKNSEIPCLDTWQDWPKLSQFSNHLHYKIIDILEKLPTDITHFATESVLLDLLWHWQILTKNLKKVPHAEVIFAIVDCH